MNTKHYICGVDYEYELETGQADHFTSVEDLKEHKLCWRSCRIMEMVLDGAGEIVSASIVADPEYF